MKQVLELKQVSDGSYIESEDGTKFVRHDYVDYIMSTLIKENNKLRKRLAEKQLRIEELKNGKVSDNM